MKALKELLINDLSGIYAAEKGFVRSLRMMEKLATTEKLTRILDDWAEKLEIRRTKLEEIFKSFEARKKGRVCLATVGILDEVKVTLAEFKGSPAIDAAIISLVQKMGHYKVATYGCLSEWSDRYDNNSAAVAFMEFLEEERETDEALTVQAREYANELALGGEIA